MRIGIDIDDTITNTQEMIDYIAQNVENKKIYDKSKHWFYERYNCSLEEDELFLRKNIKDIMMNATLKENAVDIINKLYNDGNIIYIVTARGDYYHNNIPDITIDYLKKHNIKYHDIFMGCRDKSKVCLDNKIDILIDDSIENILNAEEAGIKTITIDNEYNKEITSLRAHSWKEVYKIITGGE